MRRKIALFMSLIMIMFLCSCTYVGDTDTTTTDTISQDESSIDATTIAPPPDSETESTDITTAETITDESTTIESEFTTALQETTMTEIMTVAPTETNATDTMTEIEEITTVAESIIESEPTTTNPAVYMTADISSSGLMKAYEALGVEATGNNVAVKLSTGEAGGHNYLQPDLIKDLVQDVNGTIVECNTAYGGSRSETALHKQVAKDHGFTAIANVDIMDEEGSMALPVTNGKHLTENYVGSHFANYDYFVVLSHFKGHAMAGFGGAIKNISIGIGSREGKSWIHTAGNSKTSPWGGDQDSFLESMGEAAKAVTDSLEGNILYISVMNKLSIDCDCDSDPAEPDMHDIGILASLDPVALDQACIDLVYAAADGQSLVQRIESRNGLHTLEYADQIGLGSKTYQLVNID